MPHSYCYLEWFRQGFFTDDLTCESIVQFLNDAYNFVRDSIVFEDFPNLVVHTVKSFWKSMKSRYRDVCHSMVCSMNMMILNVAI